MWKAFFSNVIGKLLKFNFTIIEYILLIILGAVYFNGGKCFQKYIKITRENLFHMYSVRGKLFETGIVPVAMSPVVKIKYTLFKNSKHLSSNQNKVCSYVM